MPESAENRIRRLLEYVADPKTQWLNHQQALRLLLSSVPARHAKYVELTVEIATQGGDESSLLWPRSVLSQAIAKASAEHAPPETRVNLHMGLAAKFAMRFQLVQSAAQFKAAFDLALTAGALSSDVTIGYAEQLKEIGEFELAEDVIVLALRRLPALPDRISVSLHYADVLRSIGFTERSYEQAQAVEAMLRDNLGLGWISRLDGWSAISRLYVSLNRMESAIEAAWQILLLDLARVRQVYGVADGIGSSGRTAFAERILALVAQQKDVSKTLDAILILGGHANDNLRLDEAREWAARARDLLSDSPESWPRVDSPLQRLRDLEFAITENSKPRGEMFRSPVSSRPMFVLLDEAGEVVPRSAPPPPSAEREDLLKRLRVAAESGLAEDSQEVQALNREMLSLLSPGQKQDDLTDHKQLQAAMQRTEKAPNFRGDAYRVLAEAIKQGHHRWSADVMEKELRRAADGIPRRLYWFAHMATLLDALAAGQDWAEGRRWLAWWGEQLARHDGDTSEEMAEVFGQEVDWHVRSGHPEEAVKTIERWAAMDEAVLGSKSLAFAEAKRSHAIRLSRIAPWAVSQPLWREAIKLATRHRDRQFGATEAAQPLLTTWIAYAEAALQANAIEARLGSELWRELEAEASRVARDDQTKAKIASLREECLALTPR